MPEGQTQLKKPTIQLVTTHQTTLAILCPMSYQSINNLNIPLVGSNFTDSVVVSC